MIVALVVSVSCRSVILASCFNALVREMIVVSASPFFFMSVANIVSLFRGSWFSMSISLLVMGSIRGLLPLVGVMLSVFCSADRSCHLSFTSSEILIPVSLSVCSSVAVRLAHEAISWSSSVSVGMNGSLASAFMCGRFHDLPKNFRKAS